MILFLELECCSFSNFVAIFGHTVLPVTADVEVASFEGGLVFNMAAGFEYFVELRDDPDEFKSLRDIIEC